MAAERPGTGRVVAYAPLERRQKIERIDARISRFLVREGSHVEAGELLVELSDNDPELFGRLEAELALTEERVRARTTRASPRWKIDAPRSRAHSRARSAQPKRAFASRPTAWRLPSTP